MNTTEHLSGKPGYTGLIRIIKASGYSWNGLKAAFKFEAAVRQEALLLLLGSGVAISLKQPLIETFLMIAVLVLVLIVELLNSAIEATVDRIGVDHHPLSGRAKDIGSAAVFVALLFAAITWAVMLLC
ncbi:diacylglycerol kinase [uncultured Ferrimonas sp.]|uniref:diacylglycerol kinase n=1 Tax=uncultured Ferrimonas sp. TaxID=432640 RepID=UPI002613E724|nr:diacylglycerol kinase [uncultured Ferrimonas sp.]